MCDISAIYYSYETEIFHSKMGIRGLTKIIMNIQKTYPYVKYRGKIIAIDVNILIYKFCHMYHDSIPHFIEIFVHKICSFLKFGIYPVFIFDGNAPKEKHAIIKKRLSTKKNIVKDLMK